MFIVLAILAFGVIIAVHELGHFIAAKIMGVKVNEFAIGMGPKILSKQGKETVYSLRLFPFGGFCAMDDDDVSVGEGTNNLAKKDSEDETSNSGNEQNFISDDIYGSDGDTEDNTPNPRSFTAQKRWRRVVILAAGSFANFIMALIIIFILTSGATNFTGTTLTNVVDNMPELGPSELLPGDRLLYINNERLFYHDDFALFININSIAGNPIIITLERDGERIEFERRPHFVDGVEQFRYGIAFNEIEANTWERIRYSFYQTYSFIRMIRVSISMMISGAATVRDVAGPVGIVDAMNTMGQQAPTVAAGIGNIVFFTAFIGVNIAVVNLMPIPAMDGGRILFIILTWIIEKVTRRKLDPKYEAYINTGAFVLLIGLMVLVLYNDIARLIDGGGILG